MKPSPQALLNLYENNLKEKIFVSATTTDLPDCECAKLNLAAAQLAYNTRKPVKHVTCPKVGKNKTDKQWLAYCTKCGNPLAVFYSDKPSLEGNYYDLHTVCAYNKETWVGCLGMHRNPYNLEVNFECCCGNKIIVEPSLAIARYTVFKIKPVKDGGYKFKYRSS